jgi:N6-adenosine-specific RNA methylase IME4
MNKERLTRIPDQQTIVLGCYTLDATGITVKGKPNYTDHLAVGDFVKRAHRASGFWLADWLRYGESRADWREKLSQAVDATGLSEKTLKNVRAIGGIDKSRRRDDVDFSLHSEVAALDPDEQKDWLQQASDEGWTQRELRTMIRAARRTAVIDGQAVLEGMYRVIYADPPWLYSDSGPTVDGSLGKAERHYPGMTIEQLCALPVAAHALPNSVLLMWITAPLLLQNPGPRDVLEAWGFTYKTGAVWDKVLGNYGHYFHVRHEHLAICTRGSCMPDVPTPSPDSIMVERRTAHSRKPAIARKTIEQLWNRGPYLELFGREQVPGWSVFGNDARLWAQQEAAS